MASIVRFPNHVVRNVVSGRPNVACELPLTSYEIRVLKLLADDLNSKEIGAVLGISRKTVEYHREQMRQRLGIKGIAGMVRYAVRTGLIEP